MKLPLSWLREYVDVNIDVDDLAHRLTMSGTEVDAVERQGHIPDVVVGYVQDVRPHPNADKLRLVDVDDGAGTHEVVCGAPNVAAGQRIAYARIGAVLFDAYSETPGKTQKLRRAKIRGVESNGMVCSERELGIGEQHDGIVVLQTDAATGTPLGDVLGDTILHLELTPNRPDCLGIVGIARDVAALTDARLKMPPLEYAESATPVEERAQVTIDAPDLCPRYLGAVIEGVTIGPSPQWLQERLLAIGERPINNVVDATNFVMFELGQPLHAFDYDDVAEQHVIVRRANHGETLQTLDGIDRVLDADALLITDPQRGIGLAGVIGGANTEITDATTNVFLEAANFNAENNRRTATMLGIRSEATLRFEKGLRTELAEVAIRRCTRVIQQVAGGTACAGLIDAYPGRGSEPTHVDLTRTHITRVMGIDYADAEIERILAALQLPCQPTPDGWRVDIPYWRSDLTIPEDLIEEIARIGGYENLATTTLRGAIQSSTAPQAGTFRRTVADILAAQGIQQIVSYVARNPQQESRVAQGRELPDPIAIENPVSADHAVLRTSLRGATLEAAARNTRTWRAPVALFEIGKVFHAVPEEPLPDEPTLLTAVITGPRHQLGWHHPDDQVDFYDIKGIAEALLDALGIDADWRASDVAGYVPGTCAMARSRGRPRRILGHCGMVDPTLWSTFEPSTPAAYLLELNVDVLEQVVGGDVKGDRYAPYIRYPESHRDLALVLDVATPVGDALEICRQNRIAKSATVFDVYEGQGIPEGKKSVAIRVIYQSDAGTLNAKQVDRAESQIVARLERELGATLRQ